MPFQKKKPTPSAKKPYSVPSSWEKVGKWYSTLVGDEGHYYHRNIILPGILRLLELHPKTPARLLDVGCGEGVLARALPEQVSYCGIDASPSLIQIAKRKKIEKAHFILADATRPLPLKGQTFSLATIVLALQNMPHPEKVFKQIAAVLEPGAKLIIVLNHPCFRVIQGSDWQVDREQMKQYRRISHYMSERRTSIRLNPSKGEESKVTYTYQYSLATIFEALTHAGFVVDGLEEWCSDKKSTGAMAQVEDDARREIPLFLALRARTLFPLRNIDE